MNFNVILAAGGIALINVVLSGDNALVIGYTLGFHAFAVGFLAFLLQHELHLLRILLGLYF